MSEHNDGGPAFPAMTVSESVGRGGMTLRDYFAGQAMAVYDWSDASPAEHRERNIWTVIAKHCYGYADAMLAERGNGGR